MWENGYVNRIAVIAVWENGYGGNRQSRECGNVGMEQPSTVPGKEAMVHAEWEWSSAVGNGKYATGK